MYYILHPSNQGEVRPMRITGKRVMVTGGAGFIGSHLVDRLVEEGNEVVVVDDFSCGKKENLTRHHGQPEVQVVRADVCDFEKMSSLMHGVDVVLHLAVLCLRTSLRDPIRSHKVNATGSLLLCQAAVEHKVERFVYVSSAEVYGHSVDLPVKENQPFRPTHAYGASKAAGELYSRGYWITDGLPIAIVRLCNTYGPREQCEGKRAEVIPKFVMRTLGGLRPVIFGTGEQTRDFTYVDDIVRGILMAAECDELVGGAVNLARGQDISIINICNMVLEKLGRTDLEPVYLNDGRPGDLDRMWADVSKAEKLFGFSAEVDISTGLDRYIEWVRGRDIDLECWKEQEQVRNW
jgi:UDP-glucose 4-epimerase